ncbi:MAG: cob(I)yrinic acid a,c-diamide adenosyltransferase, partial [Candidatus Eremiobacteraeota bacterium]|nr:cob(I)yrinic acid a,c-diamide adenosyltransferase [Candidatus Eremiobacteraeota bacterium]
YGTVDELSSAIGVARSSLAETVAQPRARRLDDWLAWTQDVLFNLGSELATPPESRRADAPAVTARDVAALERAIDEAQLDLKPLANFIHPGGSRPGAALHLARTICRRAERLLCALRDGTEDIAPDTIRYINRLSDALFVWSRWINAGLNQAEHLWNSSTRPPEA